MGISPPTARPIRVGLLGYGLGGAAFHAPIISTTPGMMLAAIVTANETRRAQALRDYPGVTLHAHADDLWASAADLDLAVITTPNITHVPLALAGLDAGLPVVVDKPFAPNVAEARRVAAEAGRRGLPLTVFHNRRWDGDFLTVQRLMAEGRLGTVARYESRFERWRPETRQNWREHGAPGEGGGLLFDLGSHLIDQARVLFGPVRSVYAELDRRRPGSEVDDDGFVALTHESGVRSHLWMSSVAAQGGPRMRVVGSTAAYVKWGLDVQEAALRGGQRPGPGWGVEPPEQWGRLGVDGNAAPVPTEPGNYPAFYDGVVAALRAGAPVPVAPADAISVIEIIEAAQSAAAAGCSVSVRPTLN